jgi:Ca2+-binding RTX toxin-like protein
MALPTTLTDIQLITAQEGKAAYAAGGTTYLAQNQIVTLRSGLDATVNVNADAAVDPGNPKAPTITIIGAQNAAVINLASGNDTVDVGDPRETVNLGAGNDTILVTSATIGATIGNGTGTNTLEVTGGGSAQHLRGWDERRQTIAEAAEKAGRTRDLLTRHGIECPTVTGAGTFEFETGARYTLNCSAAPTSSWTPITGGTVTSTASRPRRSSRASLCGRR